MSNLAFVCALMLAAPPESEEETAPPRSYDVGDLGLSDLDSTKVADPAKSSAFGVGINTTLLPAIGQIPGGGSVATLNPGVSLRLWTGQLMIEPIFGFGFRSGDPITFRMTAGVVGGFALSDGNLRPILGGGAMFGLLTEDNTSFAITFGPMFGLEYRFESMPQFALDAALFLPLQFDFDPFAFSVATTGGALVGFHYYFGN